MTFNLAVDIGGTFTDLFAFDSERAVTYEAKCLSTPHDFSVGVMDCVNKSGVDLSAVNAFVHGSTVAINTAIERTGALTALVVTKGTRDVYQIGRGNRPDAYNIFFERPLPLAPPRLTFEVNQRTSATGNVLRSFDEKQARSVAQTIVSSGAEAIAVCFLHSYADPTDEIRMGELLREANPDVYITLSHDITRQYGEYERMSTTVLNAFIGPRTSLYIEDLENLFREHGFSGDTYIMQSNGGLMSAETAKRSPVAMMESGPVGGVMASAYVASDLGFANSIAFDMGGTTAKASLVQGREPSIADGYYIGGYSTGHPAMLPVVDIVEIGTGGGSIAWVDEVGALDVGPRSAGADPGPICYGRGGTQATVTDADVILGRIGWSSFLGGEMDLDVDAARSVVEGLGKTFNLDANGAALAIIQIAVAKMSLAVRGISVERGFDPRDFAMVATGGAGPVHASLIARELSIPKVVIPVLPAHFSARGMLLCDLRHDYVQTFYGLLKQVDLAALRNVIDNLIDEGQRVLVRELSVDAETSFQCFLDLRYEGQEFTLSVPVYRHELNATDGLVASVRSRFDEIHDRNYGHAAPEEAIEVVNVRVSVRGARERMPLTVLIDAGGPPTPVSYRKVCLEDSTSVVECPVYHRAALAPGQTVIGPAVIEEYASTTVLFPSDEAMVAETGELVVSIGGTI
ncbi:MAG TPA: hydantoinase/oxoprolinase family protein [Acidimicrobiales bacterium]|nr:hydantoinase/oxoprolinase family protein [Acidimicrobiales bacterium]